MSAPEEGWAVGAVVMVKQNGWELLNAAGYSVVPPVGTVGIVSGLTPYPDDDNPEQRVVTMVKFPAYPDWDTGFYLDELEVIA